MKAAVTRPTVISVGSAFLILLPKLLLHPSILIAVQRDLLNRQGIRPGAVAAQWCAQFGSIVEVRLQILRMTSRSKEPAITFRKVSKSARQYAAFCNPEKAQCACSVRVFFVIKGFRWCCERGLNSRPHPYQGCALPLSYHSIRERGISGRLRGVQALSGPKIAQRVEELHDRQIHTRYRRAARQAYCQGQDPRRQAEGRAKGEHGKAQSAGQGAQR